MSIFYLSKFNLRIMLYVYSTIEHIIILGYNNSPEMRNVMKDYKKYIFDLDYTLLIPDWSMEDIFFKNIIPISKQEEFFKQKQDIINKYEAEFPKYDFDTLSAFFKSYGFHLSREVIDDWMIYNGINIKDQVPDGVIDLLDYLKQNDKEVVVLTNWFSGTQISRLERAGLYNYVDKIVAGENAMKPSLKAFELAIGDTDKKDCIMIGDSLRCDKVGAENAGIDYYIVSNEHSIRKFLELITIKEKIITKRNV